MISFEANILYTFGDSFKMDIDGDGKNESITFAKDAVISEPYMEQYTLSVNGNEIKIIGDQIDQDLLALSLDGKELFLVVLDNGASADYVSTFFRYRNEQLEVVGELYDDISTCEMSNNQIHGFFRCDMIQTQYAYGSWEINTNGKLEFVESDEYQLVDYDQYKINLLMDLPVYQDRDLSSEITIITPQKVAFVSTDTKNWTYIETVDGSGGWMYTNDSHEIEELGLTSYDVFSELTLYD